MSPLTIQGAKGPGLMRQILPLMGTPSGRLYVPFFGSGKAAMAFQAAGWSVALGSDNSPHIARLMISLQSDSSTCTWIERISTYVESLDWEGQSQWYYDSREAIGRYGPFSAEEYALFFVLWRMAHSRIYRLNKRGLLNMPCRVTAKSGALKSIYSRPALAQFVAFLRSIEFAHEDFEVTCLQARAGDWVYLDPPYEGTSCGYTPKDPKGHEVTARVIQACSFLSDRGVSWALSNSVHRGVEGWGDMFPGSAVHPIQRRHSGFGKHGSAQEVLIVHRSTLG